MNDNTLISKEYHKITKHSTVSIYSNVHFLDWKNKPLPFKFYKNLDYIYLPRNFPLPDQNVFVCLEKEQNAFKFCPTKLDLPRISQILFFSAGITRIFKINNSTYYMRSASATGALYPIEIYFSCAQIQGLEDGIYHFCPGDFTLTKLYEGDFRYILYKLSGKNLKILQAPVTLIFTSVAWRNSWKYQTRSYRHWFWDAGTIISNYLALCMANSFSTEIILGFQDEDLNKLLSLKKREEAAIILSPLYIDKYLQTKTPDSYKKKMVEFETVPRSEYEVDYPEIWKVHQGSYLKNKNEVKKWLKSPNEKERYIEKLKKSDLTEELKKKGPSLKEVILKRGSTREFAIKPITKLQLEHILYLTNKNIPFDFLVNHTLVDTYLIVNSVKDLEPGSYFYDKNSNKLDRLNAGNFRKVSEHLCLEQKLFGNASIVCFFMADIDKILNLLGNRGYRAVQLEGGIRIGKMYLAAYAHGLGASGSTFYDDEVTTFFLPHSINKEPITAIGIGHPSYVSKSGRILIKKLDRKTILKDLKIDI
ncbi:MAG: SagB/ThcOx family dehydrogenase [Nitrososphaeraceae archaeon]